MSKRQLPERAVFLSTTESYYNRAFDAHGATALGVDWSTEDGQQKRFRALDSLWVNQPQLALCDFGCGYGAYADHVRRVGFGGTYKGVDLSKSMIEHARSTYGDLESTFFEIGSSPLSSDFVVGSGIFNVVTSGSRGAWAEHVWEMLAQMCEAADVGVGFNMLLETTVPYRDREDLFWARPSEVCERLESLGHQPRVITGYGLHEATYLTRTEKHGWE